MKPLQRKQVLVAQSAALRQEVSGTLDEIESEVKTMLGWIDAGVKTGEKLKQGGLWIAAAGGLILGWRWLRGKKEAPAPRQPRKSSFLGSLIGGGLETAGWIGTAVKVWRNWSALQRHFGDFAARNEEDERPRHDDVTPRFKT